MLNGTIRVCLTSLLRKHKLLRRTHELIEMTRKAKNCEDGTAN